MDFLHLVVLAVVQGITEFLPISSSGHLVLVPHLLGWEDQGLIFDISLHFGTLGAVLVYFRRDVAAMFGGLVSLLTGRYRDSGARLVVNLVTATIPVGLAGLAVKDVIESYGRDVLLLAFTSIVFGLLLWYADVLARRRPADVLRTVDDISLPTALMWGVYQAMALVPGVSRSGICVTGGRAMGATRELAGHFGSLMAIPTITLAMLLSLGDISSELNWHNAGSTLLTGAAVSFVCGLIGIKLLVEWCARVGYVPFVVYRIVLGLVLVGLFAL
ncbi:MAG: undecaprenyl-diphosphate phosphatase [Pseudomonadaceae bacterium]|nr:undecaprenyl-diphosphate phosphatase [Pseudomonadaceae bacterium]